MDTPQEAIKRWLVLRHIQSVLLIGTAELLSEGAASADFQHVGGMHKRVFFFKDTSCMYNYIVCEGKSCTAEDNPELEVANTIYKSSLAVILAGADVNALKDDVSGFPPCIVKVPPSAKFLTLPCCQSSSATPSQKLASCGLSGSTSTAWYRTDADGVPRPMNVNGLTESCLKYIPKRSGQPSPTPTEHSSTTTGPLTSTPQTGPPDWPPYPHPWPSIPPHMNGIDGTGSSSYDYAPCSRSLKLKMTEEQSEGMYTCKLILSSQGDQSASKTSTLRRYIVSRDKPLDIDDTPVNQSGCYDVNISLPTDNDKSGGEAANIYKPRVVSVSKGTKVCLRVKNPAESLKWFYIDSAEQVPVGLHAISQPGSEVLVSSTMPGVAIIGKNREVVMIEAMQKQFQGVYGFVVKQQFEIQTGDGEDTTEPAALGELTILVQVELKEDEPSAAKFHNALYAVAAAGALIIIIITAFIVFLRINRPNRDQLPIRETGGRPDGKVTEDTPLIHNDVAQLGNA